VQSTKVFFAGSIVDAGDCVVTVDAVDWVVTVDAVDWVVTVVRASLRREELIAAVLTLCGETVVPISNLKSIKMKQIQKTKAIQGAQVLGAHGSGVGQLTRI
jgi:hypothetical protein